MGMGIKYKYIKSSIQDGKWIRTVSLLISDEPGYHNEATFLQFEMDNIQYNTQ